MRAGQFSRRRPQRIRNRHAARVRTPPPLETPVNLLHVRGNIRNLVGHRTSSLPWVGIEHRRYHNGILELSRLTERTQSTMGAGVSLGLAKEEW